MAPLKPQESARGKPLDSALSTPAKTVLHALSKGVRAVSYCGFRSGLLLAAAAALRRGHEGVGLRRHRFFARKSGEKTREGAHPLNPAIGSLTIGRLHALCKILPAMLGAAFDLDCSLRPLPLCGEVTDYFFFGGANVSVRPRR